MSRCWSRTGTAWWRSWYRPRAGRALDLSDVRLAEAVRCGWLTPPVGEFGPLPAGPPVAPLADLVAEVRAGRDAR